MPFALNVTPDQLMKLIQNAGQIIKQSIDRSKEVGISQALKEELTKNAETIQSILDAILGGTGIVTQEKIDELDAQIRLQKKALLEAEAEKTKKKYGIIVGAVIVGIITLLIITRKKKQ